MLNKISRAILTIAGCAVGYGVFLLAKLLLKVTNGYEFTAKSEIVGAVFCALIFGLLFFLIAPLIKRGSLRAADRLESDLQRISTNELVSGTIGLIIGLVLAYLISQLFKEIRVPFLVTLLSIFVYLVFGFLGIFIGSRRGKEILTAWLNQRKSGSSKTKNKHGDATPKILDTSVIIDGRISDIMRTGFIEGNIVIPEFVLVELQHIADSSDSLKRIRGRRGLDILNKIQGEYGIEIQNTASEKALDEIPEVDIKLLKLAQIMNGKVVTNDYNLNKVAKIKGVEVLNINELANTLKPVVLPGEDMILTPVKEGKEQNQAVAYLDDGTMIVVEDGRRYIGETIETTVTSVLQTSAGRMIFSKPKNRK